jgi:hypothetical protein
MSAAILTTGADATILPPEGVSPGGVIYFTRIGPDEFELELPGAPPAILSREVARALAHRIEAETGAAWARTLGRSG